MEIDPKNFPRDGFLELLGVEVIDLTPERCEVRLEINDTHHQPYGIVHGGLYCTLAESAARVGAVMAIGGKPAVGMSNHTDFLRSMREGTITAVATPIHVGRSSQLWEVDMTDQEGRKVAQSKVRLFNLPDGAAD